MSFPSLPDLRGRTAVITGASRGLGRELAMAFGAAGAELILAVRDPASAEGLPGRILTCDLRQDEERRRLAAACGERVDILINNAGMQGPIGSVGTVDCLAWRETVEVNLFAPVELCRLLLPALRAAAAAGAHAKVINLSGGGATGPRPQFSAYATAKAGLVRFSETLAEELREAHIDVNCLAPGPMNTRMLDEVLAAGPERAPREYSRAQEQQATGGTPPEKAVALALWLASRESDGISGRLLSAVWDDWPSLPTRRELLQSSDLFTLRRIVPKDRGYDWT